MEKMYRLTFLAKPFRRISRNPIILLLLVIAVCVSCFFAVYKDTVSPSCINADEAAFGYNAYSLLQTGADEYGKVLPVRLKSFGDYKMPLYSYLSVPFVGILGLNEIGIRALNVFIALLFPIVIFFAVKELFAKEEIAAIAALLISVSLGKGIIERQAHEALIASFLITIGSYFFIRFLKKETYKDATLFVLSIVLSLFAYQSSRIFALFFFLFAIVYFLIRKKVSSTRKFFIILLIVGLSLFAITDIIYNPARVQNLFLTSTAGFTMRINEFNREGGSRIFYNKGTEVVREFLSNQVTYYSPQFLALDGDTNYRFGFPGMAPMTLLEYLFIFVGIYFLFRNNERWRYFILGSILISPITAALSWNGLSLTRSIFLIIASLMLSSYGFYYFFVAFAKKRIFLYLLVSLVLIESFFLFYSWDFYLNHYPKRSITVRSWQCGYQELSAYIKENYNNVTTFYITKKNGEPYIFLLFYLKYPPQQYQKQASLTSPGQYGFGQVEKFDKFVFSIPSSAFKQEHVTIIGYPDDFNNISIDKTKLKKIIIGTEEIFWIYEK